MSFSSRLLADRTLPPVGLGCMNLSHVYLPRPDEDYCEKLVNEAIDKGYRHFDSARLYGFGKNEALLGRVLKFRRNEMFITSKCGIEFEDGNRRIDCSPKAINRAVDRSLELFGLEHIDLYYLHRRDFTVPIEESVGALNDLRTAGKIGAIGLSEMSAETLHKAHEETPIAAMQSEYSLWTRNPEIAVLEACKDLGVAFVAFSPVARGALAGAVTDPNVLPEGDLRPKHPRFNSDNWPKNLELVRAFNRLADTAGVTPAQLSLFWVLDQGDHIHVIPGTKSIEHMAENFDTLSQQVTSEILTKAGELVNHGTVSGHRYPEGMRRTIDTEEFDLS